MPDSVGSPVFSAFSEMPRLISLVWKTSRTALTRSSVFAFIRIVSPDHSIEAPTFLKSKRWAISLAVWFRALSTSWWSTLLTMSNDESAMRRTLSRRPGASDEAAVGGPAGQLVAVGQLQLAQHRRHVGLDRLHRDEQLPWPTSL